MRTFVLVFGLLLFGATGVGQSDYFIHITDTHIGTTARHAETLAYIQQFNALSPQPTFIVNTGDCTELGLTEEYRQYVNLFKELKAKLINVPGNHDVRWSPIGKEGFVQWLGPLRQHWEHNGYHFFALDSTALLEHWGHFEKADLQWLERELKRIPKNAPVFLFFHHWVARDRVQIDNESEFLRIIAPYNVKAVMVGHGHTDSLWWRNGTPFLMARGLYQGSFHRVELGTDRVRIWRVRREDREPVLLLDTPRHPESPPELKVSKIRIEKGGVICTLRWQGGNVLPERWQVRFHGGWQPVDNVQRNGSEYVVQFPIGDFPAGTYRLTWQAIVGDRAYEDSRIVKIPSAMEPLWSFPTGGSLMSLPLVHENTLYVSSFDGSLYALNTRTGKRKWKADMGGSLFSSPVRVDDKILVGSTSGVVACVDLKTGKFLWKTSLPPPVFSTPGIENEVVCVAAGDGKIYGLSLRDGAKLWEFQTGLFVQSRIIEAQGAFLTGCWDNHLYALESRTGALRWKVKFGRSFYFAPAIGSPVTDGERVIVPSNDGMLHAVNVRTGEVLWEKESPRGEAFGYPTPLLQDGVVYCGTLGEKGLIYALDATTGAEKWQAEVGAIIYDAGCALAQGVLFTASVNGTLHWLDAGTGKILTQYRLPEGHLLATPATDGERFFIGSLNGTLYALPVAK